jgi:hypothetical protein
MSLVPRTVAEKIQFFQTRLPKWAEVAEQIGSTPEQIDSLEASVAAARTALAEQREAQNKARIATDKLRLALKKMAAEGSAVIARARVTAQSSGDPLVYGLASIPLPRKGSPLDTPGMPYGFELQLYQNGALELRWECDNPEGASGTLYEIYRSDRPDGEFAYIGNTGIKKFVDAKIPRGTSRVTYRIQAARSTKVGTSAFFSVNFGGVGVGGAIVPHAPRLAA